MSEPDLGVVLDALKREIGATKKYLQDLGFCVTASVALPSGGHLRFGKLGKAWCLLLVAPDGSEQPLATASIERRLEAVAYVPALPAALRKEALRVTEAAQAAARQLRRMRGEK